MPGEWRSAPQLAGGDGAAWQRTLTGELQKERRRSEALYTFAQEGEEAAQETLGDLACERSLRAKATARMVTLEDLLDEHEGDLKDAVLELRDVREKLFAKDLHVQDLEECLRTARAQLADAQDSVAEQEASAAVRAATAKDAAAKEARREMATRLANAELREDEALRELAKERDLRIRADKRIDELDASLAAHGREMNDIAVEFQALRSDVSTRDKCIQDLEARLQAAEVSSSSRKPLVMTSNGHAESRATMWESRCADLRNVLSESEMGERTRAAEHKQQLLRLECSEMRLVAKLEASGLSNQTLPAHVAAQQESKQTSVAEAENARLPKEVSRLQADATGSRREISTLRSELDACRAELADSLAACAKAEGGPAGIQSTEGALHRQPTAGMFAAPYRIGGAHREATIFETELMDCRAELAELRAGRGRREASDIQSQLLASQAEVADLHTSMDTVRWSRGRQAQLSDSSMATHRAELAGVRGERDEALYELDAYAAELTQVRRQLQSAEIESSYHESERLANMDLCRKVGAKKAAAVSARAFSNSDIGEWRQLQQQADDVDVDIAVHAAALNVAVRAELEAARKANRAEVSEAQRDRDCKPPSYQASDLRIRSLSSQLQFEQARSSKASGALEASLRALREEERVADGLRAELDAATASCAAARARSVRSAQVESKPEATPLPAVMASVRSTLKRARSNPMARPAADAVAALHWKSMYRSPSLEQRSMLRLRIEEEARLRMSLGLC
jgi:hypothetical protein